MPLGPGGTSLYWAGLNKGKRSIEVDLRDERGRDIVRQLLAAEGPGHGILVTNAVGQDWLDYDRLRQVRPDLIQVRIGGRGDGRPAVDYTVNCEVGLPWITGDTQSTSPVNHVLPAWDLLAGAQAAMAVLIAERERRMSGRGAYVELNLADIALSTMAHLGFIADVVVNGASRTREGNYLSGSYGCDFATLDGRRVMVVALTGRHWSHLTAMTGTREVLGLLEASMSVDFGKDEDRYRHRDVISAVMRPWFLERNPAQVVAALHTCQVLWGDYRTLDEMVSAEDGLLAQSDLFTTVNNEGVGVYPVPGSVLRAEQWAAPGALPAPMVGKHARQVLAEWLQLTDDEVSDLKVAGVVGWSISPRALGGYAFPSAAQWHDRRTVRCFKSR